MAMEIDKIPEAEGKASIVPSTSPSKDVDEAEVQDEAGARQSEFRGHELAPHQKQIRELYRSDRVQIVMAGFILGNFAMQCGQKQIDPDMDRASDFWEAMEDFFNVVFGLELAVNFYGLMVLPFFRSGWNLFDFLCVAIGMVDLLRIELPGPLRLLRMLRAFRVFRLFNRVPALKKIFDSLRHAMSGVMNAFAINLLVMCIYAVLAVDFYKDIHEDCESYPDLPGAVTSRGKCFGDDYYGNFALSLYTLFQILTGESWSEACVRPILHYYENSIVETFGVSVFFISFILLNGIVLMNVVVAFLLDGMNSASEQFETCHLQDLLDATTECQDAVVRIQGEMDALRDQIASESTENKNKLDQILAAVQRTSI